MIKQPDSQFTSIDSHNEENEKKRKAYRLTNPSDYFDQMYDINFASQGKVKSTA